LPNQTPASIVNATAVKPVALETSQTKPSAAVAPDTGTAPAVNPVRISWQAPAEVANGETFTVILNMNSSVPLRGAPLEIAFPAQTLELIDVTEGSFFKQEGGVTSFTHAVNTTTGRIGVGVLRNDTTGATGQAPMLSLRFKAKSAGPAELKLTSLKFVSPQGPVSTPDLPVLSLSIK
jgi:general secretion pathway protein D